MPTGRSATKTNFFTSARNAHLNSERTSLDLVAWRWKKCYMQRSRGFQRRKPCRGRRSNEIRWSFPADSHENIEARHFFTDMSILMSDGSRQIASTSDVFDYGNSYFYSSQPDSQPGNDPSAVPFQQQDHEPLFHWLLVRLSRYLLIKVNFVHQFFYS